MPYGSLLADVVQSSTSSPVTFKNTSGTEVGTLCRAWVNFDGTLSSPITPRASFNVTSVTKISTGVYTVNFTTAMPDVNYAAVVSGGTGGGNANQNNSPGGTAPTASALQIQTFDYLFNLTDWSYNNRVGSKFLRVYL